MFSYHKYGNRLAHSRQEGRITASMDSIGNEHLDLLRDLYLLDLGRRGGMGGKCKMKFYYGVQDRI